MSRPQLSAAGVMDPVTSPRVRSARAVKPYPAFMPKAAAPSDLIVRRRLLEAVREGVRGPLTLVSAPAGFGKTVLVDMWAAQHSEPVVVVHTGVEEETPSAVDFWTALMERLQGAGVDVSKAAVAGSSDVVASSTLARVSRSIAAHPRPVVWVLDFGEYSLTARVADGLNHVVERSAGRLRVVLLTRTDPPLPLHRYRLKGAITEIRAADLAFTASEASALMRRAGLELAPADVGFLHARTGGWPAGLRFAEMSLAGRSDIQAAIRAFRGDTENVSSYLISEVLAKQPPEIRRLLLRTCVVDELEPGIVEALTGQSCGSRVLQFMARGNSFIEPVPGTQGRYRYQSLFREFLRSQLSYEDAGLVPALHRMAADWYAQHARPLAAVRHAVKGQAWPSAARYFVEGDCYAGLLTRMQRTPESALAAMPADIEGAEAATTRAALALAELDLQRASSELTAARMLINRHDHPPTQACSRAITVLEAVAASLGPDLEAGLDAAVLADRALAFHPVRDQVTESALDAVLAGCKGRVLLRLGHFAAARDALAAGIEAAQEPRFKEVRTQLQSMAALVEALAGNLRRASTLAGRVLSAADDAKGDVEPLSRAAVLALASVRVDEYDVSGARHLLQCAKGVDGMSPSYDARVLRQVEALLKARLPQTDAGQHLARAELRAAASVSAEGTVSGWLDRSLVGSEAAALFALGQTKDAVAMVERAGGCAHVESSQLLHLATLDSTEHGREARARSAESGADDPLAVRVSTSLVYAAQAMREGDEAFAEVCLKQALALAAPEHLRRPFFEAGQDVRDLLESRHLATGHRWLRLTASTTGASAVPDGPATHGAAAGHELGLEPAPMVSLLTKKEEEVLGHLAELLNTDEIAEAMFVSVNTVRSHVRSILRKLGVGRRNEAVRRAWELQILPPPNAA